MANYMHAIRFTLQLAPAQTVNGIFQVDLNLDTTPAAYIVSGGLGAKTFSMSYPTPAEAKEGLDRILIPIHMFLEDLERSAMLESPKVVDSQVYALTFPSTSGNLIGSLQLAFDATAPDKARLLMTLDGAAITVKRVLISQVQEALAPFALIRSWLISHVRIDISDI